MNGHGLATEGIRATLQSDSRAACPCETPRHRWTRIGSARRDDGGSIQIDLEFGPYPGVYQIGSSDTHDLLVLAEQVPLTVYSPGTKRQALVGSARWSRSGRMLLLDLYGTSRSGACQIPGVQLVKHYVDRDNRPVDVVVPPERPA
jgi:hypothetical protein